MTTRKTIETEIKRYHTNVGRRVLKAQFLLDSEKQLESLYLRCFDDYVMFHRGGPGDFLERALDWLRKGRK
jgi:hypothetical protein